MLLEATLTMMSIKYNIIVLLNFYKAIKYGVWTSTPKNSEKLNQAYIECQKEGTSVFLFFSVVKSGQFEGIAKLTSGLQ